MFFLFSFYFHFAFLITYAQKNDDPKKSICVLCILKLVLSEPNRPTDVHVTYVQQQVSVHTPTYLITFYRTNEQSAGALCIF